MTTLLLPSPPPTSAGPRPMRWTCAEFHRFGDLGLFEDLGRDILGVVRHDSAGIDDFEAAAVVLGESVDAIARDSGFVADDGAPLPRDAIEQGGFSDVRPAYDGHERFSPCLSMFGGFSHKFRK